MWDGVEMCAVPQLLQRPVVLDAARDDDGRGDAQLLVREVDLLGGLGALELVDRQRVAVDTASTGGKVFSGLNTSGRCDVDGSPEALQLGLR